MTRPQYLYRAIDFIFGENSQPKEKFFVVFHQDEESTLLFSLTTSKSKLPSSLDNHDLDGCIQCDDPRNYMHAFVWKPNVVIGTNSFAFHKRTYVQLEFRSQLYEVKADDIDSRATSRIVETCLLSDQEFLRLLECLVKSKYLKGKHKKALNEKISTLNSMIIK